MTTSRAVLTFSAELNDLGNEKKITDGLSAVVMTGDTLWVANDETTFVERLSRLAGSDGGAMVFAAHRRFDIGDILDLPIPVSSPTKADQEIDIEGLDYRDGYLWLTGSHSLTRRKAKGKTEQDDRDRLATISGEGNRFLLARIPVQEGTDGPGLMKRVDAGTESRRAAAIRGSKRGNDLTAILAEDRHLGRFMRIPSKDNGFDIEGLAVGRDDRVFLGLRGPVLRGWAVVLEIKLAPSLRDNHELELNAVGPSENPLYRKHLIDLDGLGIRDLCVQGDDLLVLAGPTMELDGPVKVFRWRGGANAVREHVVNKTERECLIANVHYGDGCDHPEGMTLVGGPSEEQRRIMIVCDSSGMDRKEQAGENGILGELPCY